MVIVENVFFDGRTFRSSNISYRFKATNSIRSAINGELNWKFVAEKNDRKKHILRLELDGCSLNPHSIRIILHIQLCAHAFYVKSFQAFVSIQFLAIKKFISTLDKIFGSDAIQAFAQFYRIRSDLSSVFLSFFCPFWQAALSSGHAVIRCSYFSSTFECVRVCVCVCVFDRRACACDVHAVFTLKYCIDFGFAVACAKQPKSICLC